MYDMCSVYPAMRSYHGHKACSDLTIANAVLHTNGIVWEVTTSTNNQQNADQNQLKQGQHVMFETHLEMT